MNTKQQLQTIEPWGYHAVSNEDLLAEAKAHMGRYAEQCLSGSADWQTFHDMRTRLMVTWVLSYGFRTKYVRVIAKVCDITPERCRQISMREIRRAWVVFQDANNG
jgi:hypothetical protein